MKDYSVSVVMADVMEEFNHLDETVADGFWHDVCEPIIDYLRFPKKNLSAKKAAAYLFQMMQTAYDRGFEDCADMKTNNED